MQSLAAALMFAVGNNLQRRAAAHGDHEAAGPIRLFVRLLASPRWLFGGVFALVGLYFHAMALTEGGVILVQSVIATTLVFSLLLEAVVERRWPRTSEVLGAVVVVGGIALLVGIGRPGASGEFRSVGRALLVLAVVAAVGGGALYRARVRPKGRTTALALGASAGVCFALDAVFLRAVAGTLEWPLPRGLLGDAVLLVNAFGFAIASLLGNLVISRGYQRAPLRQVLPGLAAAEPLAAFLCGRLVFGEHLNGGPHGVAAVVGGLGLMLVGVVMCALGSAARRPAAGVDVSGAPSGSRQAVP